MLLRIEDQDGRFRNYLLLTLSAELDGFHNSDGIVDLTDLMFYLVFLRGDVTGDGVWDEKDAEALLREIDPVTVSPAGSS